MGNQPVATYCYRFKKPVAYRSPERVTLLENDAEALKYHNMGFRSLWASRESHRSLDNERQFLVYDEPYVVVDVFPEKLAKGVQLGPDHVVNEKKVSSEIQYVYRYTCRICSLIKPKSSYRPKIAKELDRQHVNMLNYDQFLAMVRSGDCVEGVK
ncbi:MAG: hypothetical protein KGL39_09450 [Patescibacteria group bacterium]|nr:hypothetical protein [Patescibacteria group bacterium]